MPTELHHAYREMMRWVERSEHSPGSTVADICSGTRIVSVTDRDGRTYNFEPRSDQS